MQTYEEQQEFVSKLNVIDDVFFHKIVEDKEVCEEMLRIIVEKPDLMVVESQPQRFLRNTGMHSVILDVLCQDSTGAYYNIEVQKKNDDDYQKRVRFNRSNIDTSFVESGIKYEELPDVYLVFISRFDIFGKNRTIYHINRVIAETNTIVENGTHEIYVNTAIDDGTDISMCELVEEYAKRYAEEEVKKAVGESEIKVAMNLLKNGASIELVVKSLPSLSEQFVRALQTQLM